jgi:PLD-like domain
MREPLPFLTSSNLSTWTMFCTEKDFWENFIQDLKTCVKSVDIVSPFITKEAILRLKNEFEQLRKKSIRVVIYSRTLAEHQDLKSCCSGMQKLEELDIEINPIKKIHHKIAIIDNTIWWEGSLNILSFKKSGEHMRRLEGPEAKTLLNKIGLV